MSKTAVLFVTHFVDAFIRRAFERLLDQSPVGHDVFLVVNFGAKPITVPPDYERFADRLFLCNTECLLSLKYSVKCNRAGWRGSGWTLNPGNADTIFLLFHRRHPQYEYVWGIEYDVHYEGSWSYFFEHFDRSTADLLGTTLGATFKDVLPKVTRPSGIPLADKDVVRGFFPVFRLSRRALATLDRAYQSGWSGHFELVWATVLIKEGLEIEDFGGDGIYVKPDNMNRFYFNHPLRWSLSPGSFVFRPNVKVLSRPNTLWHPVKPDYVRPWDAGGQLSYLRRLKNSTMTNGYALMNWVWFATSWQHPD